MVAALRDGAVTAVIADYPFVVYAASQPNPSGGCDLTVVPEVFGPGG